MMKDYKLQSYAMVITAMLLWGSIGIFRRNIPVPSEFLAFIRGILGAAFMGLFLLRRQIAWREVSRKNTVLLALTGGLIGLNWILFFEAFNYTTVSVAILCYYMEPTMVILLTPICFGDRLTPGKLLCVVLTMVGMVLVSGIFEATELQADPSGNCGGSADFGHGGSR